MLGKCSQIEEGSKVAHLYAFLLNKFLEDIFHLKKNHINHNFYLFGWGSSQRTQWVKNQPAVQETQVRSLGQEDPLEEGMATNSSNLAWRIPWTEEPDGLTVHRVAKSDTIEATEPAHTRTFIFLAARLCKVNWT